jgi:hypothetical protein
MSTETPHESPTLEERVQKLEETLGILIKNLARNNRTMINVLKEMASGEKAEDMIDAVRKAEGNICPEYPPGCEEDPES